MEEQQERHGQFRGDDGKAGGVTEMRVRSHPFLDKKSFRDPFRRIIHQVMQRIACDPIALGRDLIKARVKKRKRNLQLQKPLDKERPCAAIGIGISPAQRIERKIIAVIGRQAHQKQSDQKNVPGKCADVKIVEGIEIVAA